MKPHDSPFSSSGLESFPSFITSATRTYLTKAKSNPWPPHGPSLLFDLIASEVHHSLTRHGPNLAFSLFEQFQINDGQY
jgi:hypothetical protein